MFEKLDYDIKEVEIRVDLRERYISDLYERDRENIKSILEMGEEIYQNAKEHGWHEEDKTCDEYNILFFSELLEAFEEYRNDCLYVYEKDGKPEGIIVEVADFVIRLIDCLYADSFSLQIYKSDSFKLTDKIKNHFENINLKQYASLHYQDSIVGLSIYCINNLMIASKNAKYESEVIERFIDCIIVSYYY